MCKWVWVYLLTGCACIKLGTSIEVEGGLEGIPWWLWWSIIPSGISLGLLFPYSISLDVENISTSLDVDCGWGSQHGVRWPAISINDLKPVLKASKETQHYGITAWMEEGVDNSNHHSPNPRQIIRTESHWMQLNHFLQPYTALDTLLTILLTLGYTMGTSALADIYALTQGLKASVYISGQALVLMV